MESGASGDEQAHNPSNEIEDHTTTDNTEGAKSVPEAQNAQPQKRRPAKRKRVSATETFRNTLLEQQSKLIAALEDATKSEQALRERQVKAQEKLVDLMSTFLNK